MASKTVHILKLILLLTLLPGSWSKEYQQNVGEWEKIFSGLQDTFLYLLTPHLSAMNDHESFENVNRRQVEKYDMVRQKFDAFKQYHIEAYRSDATYNPDASNYFKFIPNYHSTLQHGKSYQVDNPCYQDAKAMAYLHPEDDTLHVSFELYDPVDLLCRAAFVISTDKQTYIKEYWTHGVHFVTFSMTNLTEAERWDLYDRGPRLYVFPTDLESALASLASTMLLFEPTLTQGVTMPFDQWNLNFLQDFAGIDMPKRIIDGNTTYIPDPSLISSGDTFDILRLDGLDPMIAWAMGAATGHTAIALWKEKDLYICESNAKSGYWPINGIQCNEYYDWMEYGRKADYNTVWAPLSDEHAALFNEPAAWNFINSHLGIDYGYEVVLTGWLDSNEGNSICVDVNRTWCLEPGHHLELVFSVAENIEPVARLLKPAMMQRAGLNFDAPLVDAYYWAFNNGIDPGELHNLEESDTYKYETTKYGEPHTSDVSICNVFVCKVLRASGIFKELAYQFNCGEVSVNDMYRLNIYDENTTQNRPEACKQRDPENPLCQVLGKYSLRLDSQPGVLPRYNYVPLHPDFAANCPSQAPDYLAPIDC